MFLLQKATDVTAAQLTQAYAFPSADRPVIRANMVASVDGAATADGKSAGLGGDGDHRIFHLQRSLADAIVVGAQTAVTEGYRPPTVAPEYADERAGRGQSPAPLLVLVSRSLSIPADYATIADAGVVIATCESAPADARRRLLDAGATLVDCGADDVDPHQLVAELAAREANRVLCEGGPRFLATIAASGLLDELALTVSPVMACGDAARIAHGASPDLPVPMRLHRLLGDDEGFVFQLWKRALPQASDATD